MFNIMTFTRFVMICVLKTLKLSSKNRDQRSYWTKGSL